MHQLDNKVQVYFHQVVGHNHLHKVDLAVLEEQVVIRIKEHSRLHKMIKEQLNQVVRHCLAITAIRKN